jgi:hypothetical protein
MIHKVHIKSGKQAPKEPWEAEGATHSLAPGTVGGPFRRAQSHRAPIEPDNPLLGARNCLITPHIAWATAGARGRVMHSGVAKVSAFLAGRPINVVNGSNRESRATPHPRALGKSSDIHFSRASGKPRTACGRAAAPR